MRLGLKYLAISIITYFTVSSASPVKDKRYEHHIMLPILQQPALAQYQKNRAEKRTFHGDVKPESAVIAAKSAKAPAAVPVWQMPPKQQPLKHNSPRDKMNWSYSYNRGAASSTRGGWARRTKRQDVGGGGKEPGELDPEAGPYPVESLLKDGNDEDNSAELETPSNKHTSFRNWDEYKDVKKMQNMQKFKPCKGANCNDSAYIPVINPDQHFRDMDKLYKKKNDRVRTFYALNLFLRKQGKKFQFPTKAPLDFSQTCEDGRPPPCHGTVLL